MSRQKLEKVCEHCGQPFAGRSNAKFCSSQCRNNHNKQGAIVGSGAGLCPADTGALSELVVCTDLMQRKFDVCRAVSPACSCDLIAMRNGRMFRIEVRTGAKYLSKTRPATVMVNREHRADILAVVIYENPPVVIYDPDFPDD